MAERDGLAMFRRIPSFSVVIARRDTTCPPPKSGVSGRAGRGTSLADRLAQRDQLKVPAGKAVLCVKNPSVIELALAGGPVLFRGLSSSEPGNNLTVDAGTYDIVVEPVDASCGVVKLLGVKLQGGSVYTVSG
jgi:hypothetical protein